MKPAPYTYNDMPLGEQALNTGNISKAETIFRGIIDAMKDEVPAEVYEQLGITLRMLADQDNDSNLYEQADAAFREAYGRANDDLRLGQITRNWAMVALNQGDFDMAQVRLRQSLLRLQPTRKLRLPWVGRQTLTALSFVETCRARLDEDDLARTKSDAMHLEYYVSVGFLARLHYLRGGFRNRHVARKLFRRSNRELHGVTPYELNNRVWHFKVEWWWFRLLWAPRTLSLAYKSGNTGRLKQVALLIISERLANYAEKVWKAR